MSRVTASRFRLTGTFKTDGPLHIGGIGGDVDSDMALARDGQGRLYVPGTSLTGALRQLWEDAGYDGKVWGFAEGDSGNASFIQVEDSVLVLPSGASVEIREGVGMDRITGAAARNIKFNAAVVPKGATFDLRLLVDLSSKDNPARAQEQLEALAGSLKAGELRLGGGTTRGRGKVALAKPKLTCTDLSTCAGMLQELGIQPIPELSLTQRTLPPRNRLSVEIHWEPDGPLMVGAAECGNYVDSLPLTSFSDGDVALVLPGSSIKGAFRSHAERIVRTLAGANAAEKFDDQLLGTPLCRELFGHSPHEKAQDPAKPHEKTKDPGAKGLLFVDECYAQEKISRDDFQAMLNAATAEEWGKAKQRHDKTMRAAHHVANDRWTGGAADTALFVVLEPHGQKWDPITLELNLARTKNPHANAALLLVALRAFEGGHIPLGGKVNRGMGSVKVNKILLSGGDGLKRHNTRLSDVLKNETLRASWRESGET